MYLATKPAKRADRLGDACGGRRRSARADPPDRTASRAASSRPDRRTSPSAGAARPRRRPRWRGGRVREGSGAPLRRAAIAASSLRRCPIDVMPSPVRSSAVSSGSTAPSMSLAAKAGAYCPRPSPPSQSATSTGTFCPSRRKPRSIEWWETFALGGASPPRPCTGIAGARHCAHDHDDRRGL